MNKQTRYYVAVALTVLLSLAGLVYGVSWLSGAFRQQYRLNALFDDARGISQGSFIYMAGVNIGQIKAVDLAENGRQAELKLLIEGKYKIPVKSRLFLKTGLLANQATLTVTPSDENTFYKEGDTIVGDSSDPIGDVLGKAPATIDKLTATMDTTAAELQKTMRESQATLRLVRARLADPKLDRILGDLQETTAELPGLTRQIQGELATVSVQTNQLLAGLQGTQRNANQVIAGAGKLTGNLNAALTENRATIRSLLRSADEAASAVAGLTEQVSTLVADPTLQGNLKTTSTNLASISARMDTAASNLERLTSDPRLASDIRETVTNLRATSESVKNLTGRIETIRIPGEKRPRDPNAPPPAPRRPPPLSFISLYEPGLVLDPSYDTKGERLRLDSNYTFLTGRNNGFYRFGIYDATERNRVNLQVGRGIGGGENAAYRYGLFAGKLGAGLDLGSGPLALRFDLFDPNRFTINARARAYLNPNTAVTAGVDSVGKENRATVGITIRR
jgi:phospholipid/cholesterol/gamma-HCH transport system substrate-binding protein